jgi:hypothetical protein
MYKMAEALTEKNRANKAVLPGNPHESHHGTKRKRSN